MRLALIFVAILIGGYFVSDWTYQRANPGRIASFLNVDALPKSVGNMRCDSTAITDIVIECEFDFDPADLPHLVAGRAWQGGGIAYNYSEPSPKKTFPLIIQLVLLEPSHGKVTYYQE